MSNDLQEVLSRKLDLYEVLELESSEVSHSDVRQRYHILALRYHPDKTKNKNDESHLFHDVALAARILSDQDSRKQYDSWYETNLAHSSKWDKTRLQQMKNLEHREKHTSGTPNELPLRDLNDLQEYGELARKLKHFKVPIVNWHTLNGYWKAEPSTSTPMAQGDQSLSPQYQASTLRVVLRNSDQTSSKDNLNRWVQENWNLELRDAYYSNNNDYLHDEELVAYLVFQSPTESAQFWNQWNERNTLNESDPMNTLGDVSPKIPLSFFSSVNISRDIELNSGIAAALNELQDD